MSTRAKKAKAGPANWPANAIERWPLAKLIPYARNSRIHSPAQIKQIARSIQEFGWTIPVLVDEGGGIICGHARVLAAGLLGIIEIPVMIARGWSEAQKRAYIIADNKLTLNADWDEDFLKFEIDALRDLDFDLGLTGFSDDELAALSNFVGLTDPDDAPEVDLGPPIARLGDLWILGRHRLLCGDATSADDVSRLMAGRQADLCLTDPPYGIDGTVSVKNDYRSYEDTADNLVSLIPGFMSLAQASARVLVLTPGNGNMWRYPPPAWTMAWFTPAGVGSGPWGFCCWQPVLCYGKDPKLTNRKGRHPDALVHTETAEKLGHPCSKPIKFWSWLMERASEAGDRIYDPFVGSGTTIIAAEMSGRACHAIEIDPAYVDVAIKRWQDFTGDAALLDGQAFEEIRVERLGAAVQRQVAPTA